MKKPWSISTTVRNPERIKKFLLILKQLENQIWDEQNQKKFQILLIQNRLYGCNNVQFQNGLKGYQIEALNDLSKQLNYAFAEEIFFQKKYEDPAMRGRQSINPLKKLGFISVINGKIIFNDIANRLINDEADIGDVFFKCFLKWQIPNLLSDDYKYEDGYDIIPFIATLKLFDTLHKLDKNFKGLSKEEFAYFVPTMINYKNIYSTAQKIIEIRKTIKKNKADNKIKKEIYHNYLNSLYDGTKVDDIVKYTNNLNDYGDNIIRYFRITRYFYLRGNGYYIDLEPSRHIEISELLKMSEGNSINFESVEEYQEYLENPEKPELPWLKKGILLNLGKELLLEAKQICYNRQIELPDELLLLEKLSTFSEKNINELRKIKLDILNKINYLDSQKIDTIKKYITELENIDKSINKAMELEKLITNCLYALNDAIKIKPNYPVGDDNQPIFFAPSNMPDIECYYDSFDSICEVTMLKTRDQWYNEGQPVMRHLRDFENKTSKDAYCIFIAPVLHRDTLNTFWISIKYEFEGRQQKIIPFTIDEFLGIMKWLVSIKEKDIVFSHRNILSLFNNIVSSAKTETDVLSWRKKFPKIINEWMRSISGELNAN